MRVSGWRRFPCGGWYQSVPVADRPLAGRPSSVSPGGGRLYPVHQEMGNFRYEGHRLAYTVHGRGDRTTVLLPGLLLSQKMQTPLARALAARGHRVITLDPLGHGASDRPRES